MKQKHFYYKLVEIEELLIELDDMGFEEDEKWHLATLIDANIHNAVLEVVFMELEEDDKHLFIEYMSVQDHDKIWEHLNTKGKDMDKKIKQAVDNVKKELLLDIKEAKEKKND